MWRSKSRSESRFMFVLHGWFYFHFTFIRHWTMDFTWYDSRPHDAILPCLSSARYSVNRHSAIKRTQRLPTQVGYHDESPVKTASKQMSFPQTVRTENLWLCKPNYCIRCIVSDSAHIHHSIQRSSNIHLEVQERKQFWLKGDFKGIFSIFTLFLNLPS